MNLVNGYAGEGHISSSDVQALVAGICGQEGVVLKKGGFPARLNSGMLMIGAGDAIFKGRHFRIPVAEGKAISSGIPGTKRIDLVCIRYSQDSSTGIESGSIYVVMGTAVSGSETPQTPAVTSNDMPLYKITWDGASTTGPVAVYSYLMDMQTREMIKTFTMSFACPSDPGIADVYGLSYDAEAGGNIIPAGRACVQDVYPNLPYDPDGLRFSQMSIAGIGVYLEADTPGLVVTAAYMSETGKIRISYHNATGSHLVAGSDKASGVLQLICTATRWPAR